MQARSLDHFAQQYDADKRVGRHGYTRFYERHLHHVKVRNLLEIGIYKGASLRMWADYLPAALIHGIDLSPPPSGIERIRTYRVDQGNRGALAAFASFHGPWDVILDDGSHLTSHQIGSFEVLWPHLNPGGFYVVEDAFTSFLPEYADSKPSLFEYFHALTLKHHRGRWYSDDSRTEVDWIEFSTGLIVIGKAP